MREFSNDRLWMVQYYCERWGVDNPISIAVLTDRSADEIKSELVSLGCSEQNLTVQTVSKTRYDPTGKEYPVNLLRNLAFSAVKTSHITYADVDFRPASDLPLLSDEKTKERLASDSKLATVLPVFQLNRQCESYNKVCCERNIPQMPKDKEELINLIQKKAVSTTQLGTNGHSSTKYKTWMNQKTGTFVDLPCFKSNKYEPYLTVRYCSDLPPFQEGFTGYGKNKITVSLCAFAYFLRLLDDRRCLSHFFLFSFHTILMFEVGDATPKGWLLVFSTWRCIPRPVSRELSLLILVHLMCT